MDKKQKRSIIKVTSGLASTLVVVDFCFVDCNFNFEITVFFKRKNKQCHN